jgi:hypothetical protein
MTTSTKTRLGEFFRSQLNGTDIKFFLNNADTDEPPPYGVVTVTEMEETTPRANVYKATIKIAVVTSIDISNSAQHDTLLESVMNRLYNIPKQAVDSTIGIRLFGWTMTLSESITKDESQSFSDVITIIAGCGG